MAGAGVISESVSAEITLGVEVIVPHVINLFTAAGPNWEGVGDGREGKSGKSVRPPRGTSIVTVTSMHETWLNRIKILILQGVPAIAAPILLRVGLEGTELAVSPSSFDCSGKRVLACLICLRAPFGGAVGRDVGPS